MCALIKHETSLYTRYMGHYYKQANFESHSRVYITIFFVFCIYNYNKQPTFVSDSRVPDSD
jgi:hypothetical protein